MSDDDTLDLSNIDERNALISELQQQGIKHTREKIIRIAKLPHGKIIFLEVGTTGPKGSGLLHILENHQLEFTQKAISPDDLPDAIMMALTHGNIVGYQQPDRPIYQITLHGKIQLIAITVSDNGYIVCANPRSV